MKDLTRYDYDEQVERMTNVLKEAAGWGDGFDSTMGQTLIQLVADMTDNLHYMLERRSIEGHLISAKLRTSKIVAASSIGYRVRRAIANSGVINVELRDENGDPMVSFEDIIVRAGTPVTSGGNNYVLTEDLVIPIGHSSGTVTVKQGDMMEMVFDTEEPLFVNSNFFVISDYENMDNDVLYIFTDNEEYTDIRKNTDQSPARRALSFVGPNDNFYDLRFSVNGMRVVFGDDTFGRKPSGNVTVRYLNVDPDLQEVITLGNEFEFEEPLVDQFNNEYEYVATNITSIRGGKDAESDVELVENALSYLKSNMRCVSNDDWDYWAKEARVGNIVDIKSAGEYELESIVYAMNNVFLTYLTSDGEELTVEEQQRLRNYLQPLKMVTTHIVLNKAAELLAQINVSVKRDKTLPISDAELYTLILRFFEQYFAIGSNSIGNRYELTDIIRDLYKLQVSRNGITYNVVDYLKLNMNALYPFSVPTTTNNVIVSLNGYTSVDGDIFGLIINDTPVGVEVDNDDTAYSLLNKMKDQIYDEFELIAQIELLGASIDPNGNPIPLDVDDDNVFAPIKVISLVPDIVIQHNYFTGVAGRRDIIPLGDNTQVEFTAPSDTDVLVYVREVVTDPETETLLTTVAAGTTFANTFTNGSKSMQLKFVNNTGEVSNAIITYPDGQGLTLGLRINTLDGFGQFDINTSIGDLQAFTNISYVLNLPVRSRSAEASIINIFPASLEIIKLNGEVVYTTNRDGLFFDVNGTIVGGRVNHQTGQVILPSLDDDSYYIKFLQDKFENLGTDRFAAIRLLEPKPSLTSSEFSLSTIEVE